MGRVEETHEFEGKVEFVTAKSRLVEDSFTGVRYWVPKSQTYDMNASDDNGNYMFVVSDWWWKKKGDFVVQDRE